MKKIISVLSIIIILLTVSFSVFAGDVPESLLSEDGAKLFIGKVDAVTTMEHQSMPYEENRVISIDITPTYKYKGDVKEGVSERYTHNDFGSFIPEKDKEYLFGYIDENNFYVYEIESRDEHVIKLVNSDKFDMTNRLETYINDGAFAIAEKERSTLGEQITFANFLYQNPLSDEKVQKVTLRYQDNICEVEKDKFLKLADEIMITNVKNDTLYDIKESPTQPYPYETILYIELLDANEQLVGFGAVSRYGEVDKYMLAMSRLMSKDYEMKQEDLSKLYSLFPEDVRQNIGVNEVDTSIDNTNNSILICILGLLFLTIILSILLFVETLLRKTKN